MLQNTKNMIKYVFKFYIEVIIFEIMVSLFISNLQIDAHYISFQWKYNIFQIKIKTFPLTGTGKREAGCCVTCLNLGNIWCTWKLNFRKSTIVSPKLWRGYRNSWRVGLLVKIFYSLWTLIFSFVIGTAAFSCLWHRVLVL